MSYMEWWYEWALDDYPKGTGVFHEEGVPILNPWALKAANLSITTKWEPPSDSRPNFNIESAKGDEAWPRYMEFMQVHFSLTDQGCFGFYIRLSRSFALAMHAPGACRLFGLQPQCTFLLDDGDRALWQVRPFAQ